MWDGNVLYENMDNLEMNTENSSIFIHHTLYNVHLNIKNPCFQILPQTNPKLLQNLAHQIKGLWIQLDSIKPTKMYIKIIHGIGHHRTILFQ